MSNQTSENLDPAWYKDAVIHEVHVRSLFDSSQDGQVLEVWSDMPESEQERSGVSGLLRNIDWLLDDPVQPEKESHT